MVTTRRSSNTSIETFATNNGSDVALLERKIPTSYNEYTDYDAPVNEENLAEEKEKRQKNLEKLLNYDRYSASFADVSVPIEEDVIENVVNMSEDDIRPTSTTMQFGDTENIDKIYNEMPSASEKAEESFRLNGRGKLVVALYAVAITIIMALIILNTSVLSVLSRQNAEKTATLNEIANEYSELNNEIEYKTSNEYVSGVAENEYGMSIR